MAVHGLGVQVVQAMNIKKRRQTRPIRAIELRVYDDRGSFTRVLDPVPDGESFRATLARLKNLVREFKRTRGQLQ